MQITRNYKPQQGDQTGRQSYKSDKEFKQKGSGAGWSYERTR